jgi:hypothetical protein
MGHAPLVADQPGKERESGVFSYTSCIFSLKNRKDNPIVRPKYGLAALW